MNKHTQVSDLNRGDVVKWKSGFHWKTGTVTGFSKINDHNTVHYYVEVLDASSGRPVSLRRDTCDYMIVVVDDVAKADAAIEAAWGSGGNPPSRDLSAWGYGGRTCPHCGQPVGQCTDLCRSC